jgi:RNA polymerase sigma-70 factor (ECF subfamily)
MAGTDCVFSRCATVTPTSNTLLDRLKVARSDDSEWNRFEALYLPLIRRWIGRIPGLGNDVEDVSQEVLLVLVREIPRFDRQREGSFRAWLRQVTVNRVRVYRRQQHRQIGAIADQTDGFLDQMTDSNSRLARQLDVEHNNHVCETLLSAVRSDFNQMTWDAFQQFAVEGRPAAEVARELGLTVNAVVKAKVRVLNRLREEAAGLLE